MPRVRRTPLVNLLGGVIWGGQSGTWVALATPAAPPAQPLAETDPILSAGGCSTI